MKGHLGLFNSNNAICTNFCVERQKLIKSSLGGLEICGDVCNIDLTISIYMNVFVPLKIKFNFYSKVLY